MVSLFFIVLKLNFSGLTLQLFLNVWFKNEVDCRYHSTSRLLHIIIQSSALLAANPSFLWIYLKQLEGCARSPREFEPFLWSCSLVAILCEGEMGTVQKLMHTDEQMEEKPRQRNLEADKPSYEVIQNTPV